MRTPWALKGEKQVAPQHQAAIDKARALWEEKRFFHWDLEFPEVFVDLQKRDWAENPGFDAVIGNPPYVRQEQLGSNKPYFQVVYAVFHGSADLYTYFVELGLRLLCKKGEFGFITSNKFMRANYGTPLRKWLTAQSRLRQLVDFGELPVFGHQVATFPLIMLGQRTDSGEEQKPWVTKIKHLDFASLEVEVQDHGYPVEVRSLQPHGWTLASSDQANLLEKLEAQSTTLEEYTANAIYRGVVTGLNAAFLIDQATRDSLIHQDASSSDLLKPLIVGDNVRHYEIDWKQRYLIFTRRGIDITRYPAILQYLKQYRHQLEPKPVDHHGDWVGRKSGQYEWYELQDTVDYWEAFEQPKIVYPVIAREPRFAFDDKGYFPNDKIFVIPGRNLFLLALLNSSLLFSTAKVMVSVLGDEDSGGRLELRAVHFQRLPIHHIAFTTPSYERTRLLAEGQALAAVWVHQPNAPATPYGDFLASPLGAWLTARLAGSPEVAPDTAQSDVVHDLLAHLAGEMLAMNKAKQEEMQGFLGWLERQSGAKIDDLGGKTYLQNYLGDYQKGEVHLVLEEVLKILRKNRRKLNVDPDSRRFQQWLVDEYDESLEKLLPLKHQLAATDRLIDLMVYRLYGLTDEEVAIVEGTKGSIKDGGIYVQRTDSKAL